jgi:hypothetical protein
MDNSNHLVRHGWIRLGIIMMRKLISVSLLVNDRCDTVWECCVVQKSGWLNNFVSFCLRFYRRRRFPGLDCSAPVRPKNEWNPADSVSIRLLSFLFGSDTMVSSFVSVSSSAVVAVAVVGVVGGINQALSSRRSCLVCWKKAMTSDSSN